MLVPYGARKQHVRITYLFQTTWRRHSASLGWSVFACISTYSNSTIEIPKPSQKTVVWVMMQMFTSELHEINRLN